MSDWTTPIIKNMHPVTINGNSFQTYDHLPENLYASLYSTAKRFPAKTALLEEGNAITYGEFLRRADSLASSLYEIYQIRKGDVCALLIVNSIDFCVAFYALSRIGAIAMPLSTKLKSRELLHPLVHSGANLLILDEKWLENVIEILPATEVHNLIFAGEGQDRPEGARLRKLLPSFLTFSEPKKEDHAILMYTSGTTGKSKGVLISNFNLMHGIESYRRILDLGEQDSTIISIPIFHITGLAALLGLFVYIGGTIHLLPYFNAEKTVRCIHEHSLTFMHASPTVFLMMLEQQSKFPQIPSLTKCACGSANLPIEVIRKLHQWNSDLKMYTVYGLTETSSPATIMPGDPLDMNKMGSSGLPIPGLELRIIDPESQKRLPPGSIGELEVRGSVVVTQYFNAEESANAVFCQGWFNTGDIAKVDPDGFVYILDRKKDMISRGGEKIYSIEVENAINEIPDVLECAVIGEPDELYGEVIKAVIRLRENAKIDGEQITTFIQKSLANFKLPSSYEFVDSIPKTENGKISKRLLKEQLQKTEKNQTK